jgi:uncharacterized protein YbgA (DUF1722 family)
METLKLIPAASTPMFFPFNGLFENHVDPADKAELTECIDEYRKERVPIIVPMTLLKHHFRRHPHPWVIQQTYLNPYPSENDAAQPRIAFSFACSSAVVVGPPGPNH